MDARPVRIGRQSVNNGSSTDRTGFSEAAIQLGGKHPQQILVGIILGSPTISRIAPASPIRSDVGGPPRGRKLAKVVQRKR
jgi:hypothetical protein